MNDSLKSILFLFGGIAVGVTAGILLAPKSGKETREDIAESIDQLQSKITGLAKEKLKKVKGK